MTFMPWHPSQGFPTPRRSDPKPLDLPWDDLLIDVPVEALRLQRADCCVGNAAFRVVLPPRGGRRRPAELLLCAHHQRSSLGTLAQLGASVFDDQGRLVASYAEDGGR